MESRQRNAAREISPSLLAARQGIKMDDRLGNMYYLIEKKNIKLVSIHHSNHHILPWIPEST
jgi:hypothetical protein